MKLIVDVPDDLAEEMSLEWFYETALPDLFSDLRGALKEEKTIEAILNTEEGFAKFISKYEINGAPVAMVRRSTYQTIGDHQMIWHQPWSNNFNGRYDSTRFPVYMRGSLVVLDARYGSEWLEKLAVRYLRFIKYTCTDTKENRDNIDRLKGRIWKKFSWSRRKFGLSLNTFFTPEAYTPCFGVGPMEYHPGFYIYWLDGERCRGIQMPIRSQRTEVLRLAQREVKDMTQFISRVAKGLRDGNKRDQGLPGHNTSQHCELEEKDAHAVGTIREGGNLRNRRAGSDRLRSRRDRFIKG